MRRLPLLLLFLIGCKQSENERCQISEDCEPPLVCSASEPKVCRPSGSDIVPDAAPMPDSRFDARLFDANTTPPDGAPIPDAAPVPDAPLAADAAEPDAT